MIDTVREKERNIERGRERGREREMVGTIVRLKRQ